ncbi:hypothetical protein EVG20_g810 [Dentipellis fragilis]|uniref:Uncharacterized protein n=1 Tax=Dentipellis fragilis TaxID=205917 RepID=A0A4Y9ZDH0_9AGAM|nr:hypothetical protein EVG20_g810 [Dentipellis fragilis]
MATTRAFWNPSCASLVCTAGLQFFSRSYADALGIDWVSVAHPSDDLIPPRLKCPSDGHVLAHLGSPCIAACRFTLLFSLDDSFVRVFFCYFPGAYGSHAALKSFVFWSGPAIPSSTTSSSEISMDAFLPYLLTTVATAIAAGSAGYVLGGRRTVARTRTTSINDHAASPASSRRRRSARRRHRPSQTPCGPPVDASDITEPGSAKRKTSPISTSTLRSSSFLSSVRVRHYVLPSIVLTTCFSLNQVLQVDEHERKRSRLSDDSESDSGTSSSSDRMDEDACEDILMSTEPFLQETSPGPLSSSPAVTARELKSEPLELEYLDYCGPSPIVRGYPPLPQPDSRASPTEFVHGSSNAAATAPPQIQQSSHTINSDEGRGQQQQAPIPVSLPPICLPPIYEAAPAILRPVAPGEADAARAWMQPPRVPAINALFVPSVPIPPHVYNSIPFGTLGPAGPASVITEEASPAWPQIAARVGHQQHQERTSGTESWVDQPWGQSTPNTSIYTVPAAAPGLHDHQPQHFVHNEAPLAPHAPSFLFRTMPPAPPRPPHFYPSNLLMVTSPAPPVSRARTPRTPRMMLHPHNPQHDLNLMSPRTFRRCL